MKVLIVGAGAVGGTFGAKLARGGHEVSLVARGAHGRAIAETGLVLETPDGEIRASVPVFESVEAARGQSADVALIAVKWAGLEAVAAPTGAALAPGGVAIPLLNGLDVEEALARVIGAERVIGGVAQLSAAVSGPGRVRLSAGGMVTLAPFLPDQAERTEALAQRFAQCFPCHAERDLARVRWQKLLWNAPFNAVCALTRRRAGEVLAMPALEALVRRAMREVIAVARAEGVALDDGAIDAMIGITHGVFSGTEPSMLQDVLAGRPTEADELQGAVVARGRKHGIDTPALETLHALVAGLGAGSRNA
jgi:2-dehydropantoate 2-reductase